MTATQNGARKAAYYRLSGYYILFFAVYGIAVPLWPRWLEGFLSAREVGIVLATAYWLKLLYVPISSYLADKSGDRRQILITLAAIFLAGILVLPVTTDWVLVAVIWGLCGAALTSIIPLSDGLTILADQKLGLDFGRTRLWGSLSFIVFSLLVGKIVDLTGRETIYIAILIAASGLFLFSFMLPRLKTDRSSGGKTSLLAPLKLNNFPLFVTTAALLLSSHAALYGFASIHWKANGYNNTEITLFWVIGVVVEVIVFLKGSLLVSRIGAMPMISIAAIGGTLRWTLLANFTSPVLVVIAQAMHGLTFALLYMAVMAYVGKRVPIEIAASAQGLFDMLAMGIFFGFFTRMSGYLYELDPGYVFYAMTILSAIGGILSFILLYRVRKSEAV